MVCRSSSASARTPLPHHLASLGNHRFQRSVVGLGNRAALRDAQGCQCEPLGTDAAGLRVARSRIAEHAIGADALFRGKTRCPGHHRRRGVSIGKRKSQAARAVFLERVLIQFHAFDDEVVQTQAFDETQRRAPTAIAKWPL